MKLKSINEVKELYKKIPEKSKFFLKAQEQFGVRAVSLKVNWFSGTWAIPENKVAEVIIYMAHYIDNLNK